MLAEDRDILICELFFFYDLLYTFYILNVEKKINDSNVWQF